MFTPGTPTRQQPLLATLLTLSAGLMLAAVAALAVTPAASAQADPTLTFEVVDSDPDAVHLFRFLDGPDPVTVTAGQAASLTFASGETVNVRPAAIVTNYYSAAVCDDDAFQIIDSTFVVRGPMPDVDVTCTWTSSRDATITIVTEAPRFPNWSFDYVFNGFGLTPTISQGNGDSTTIPVPVDTPIRLTIFDLNRSVSVSCTDDNAGASAPGLNNDVDFQLPAGTNAVCTATHGEGPYRLIVEVDDPTEPNYEHPFSLGSSGSVNATNGSPAEFLVPAGDSVYLTWFDATAPFSSVSCDDPDFGISIRGSYATGTMPRTNVTCTVSVDRSTSVTIVADAPAGAPDDAWMFFRFSLATSAGQTYLALGPGESATTTIMADQSYILHWLARLGWAADLTCVDDNGGATIAGFNNGADLRLPAGTNATCTYSFTFVGTATVIFEVESDDPSAFVEILDPYKVPRLIPVAGAPVTVEATLAGVYVHGMAATAAVAPTPDRCPAGFTSDTNPVTTSSNCFATVITAAQLNSLIANGADCSGAVARPNETAIGFCVIDVVPGTPGSPAVAAVPATCNGVVTTAPKADCDDLRFELWRSSTDLPIAGGCDDPSVSFVDPEVISWYQPMLTGLPSPGATVTCTILAPPTPTVPISLTIDGPAGEYKTLRITSRKFTGGPFIEGTQTAGQTVTTNATVGDFVRLFVYYGDGVTSPDWVLTDAWCTGDNGVIQPQNNLDVVALQGVLPLETSPDPIHCRMVVRDSTVPVGVYPTVSCLSGNGRIDLNILNVHSAAHSYQVQIGSLPARIRTVAAQDWWRSPVTGRPDGPISVTVLRDGELIYEDDLIVACGDAPRVSAPEIQILNTCRGGNGFVAWQFVNPTDASRSYIIEFDGVPNRSTTAAPHGAAVRGVSGRADGAYSYAIKADGVLVREDTVSVSCDEPVGPAARSGLSGDSSDTNSDSSEATEAFGAVGVAPDNVR